MQKLLVATGNKKKLGELQELLSSMPYELVCLDAFENIQEVEETGKTFEANAELKALGYAEQTGLLTIAEDSGLCCHALEEAPGVYSARFSGPDKDDLENNQKVLRLLKDIPDNCRTAYFKSAIAVAKPGQMIGTVSGEVHGYISHEMKGTNGFGYDAIFYYPAFNKNFGEVPSEMKHEVSHRAKSLQKAKKLLEEFIEA